MGDIPTEETFSCTFAMDTNVIGFECHKEQVDVVVITSVEQEITNPGDSDDYLTIEEAWIEVGLTQTLFLKMLCKVLKEVLQALLHAI